MRFQTLYEGRWIFAILFSLAIVCSFFSVWLTLICLALIGYTLAFFRDPARRDPLDTNGVVGDELKRGERFGMIRFGSRTEVYLPLSAKVLVKVGDRVKGGASVIAQLPE